MSDLTGICTGLQEGEAVVLARRTEDIPYTQGMRGLDGQRRAWVRSANGDRWLMYPGDSLTFTYTLTDDGTLALADAEAPQPPCEVCGLRPASGFPGHLFPCAMCRGEFAEWLRGKRDALITPEASDPTERETT